MEIKHILVPFIETKADDAGTVSGYGSTFGNVDLGRDVVAPGAFRKTLAIHKADGTLPALYFSHDHREPVGDWLSMEEDEKGLRVSGKLWIGKGIPKAEQAYLTAKGTGPKGLSIGYATRDSRTDPTTGVRTLLEVDLYEVSVTGYPMNPKAAITDVKAASFKDASGKLRTVREIEEVLCETHGLSRREAKAFIADGFRGLGLRDAEQDDQLHQIINTLSALRG